MMIELERMNGRRIFLNPRHIQMMEATPDTMLTLQSGEKVLVKDSLLDIIEKIKAAQG